ALTPTVAGHDAAGSAGRSSGGSRCNAPAIAQPISEPDPNTATPTLANRPAKPDALAKLSAEADAREARAAALGSNPGGSGNSGRSLVVHTDMPATETELKQFRAEKDHVFAHDPGSPIPADQRPSLKGLIYFDENHE